MKSVLSFIKVSDCAKLIFKIFGNFELLLLWIPINNCSELRTKFLAKINKRTLRETDRAYISYALIVPTSSKQHLLIWTNIHVVNRILIRQLIFTAVAIGACVLSFMTTKAKWERSVFFLQTPTALSLNPLISSCEILPFFSLILND